MATWDIVVVEPDEPGISQPTDENLQAVTTDYADEASARQAYVEKLQEAVGRRHTAVQLRCDGRILEQWPDPAQ